MQDTNDTTPPNPDTTPPANPDLGAERPEDSSTLSPSLSTFEAPAEPVSPLEMEPASVVQPFPAGSQFPDPVPADSTPIIQPPAPQKKRWVVAAIIAGALVLLGGGGASAYAFWYQNPDKVLGDAFVNAIRAKSVTYTGTMDIKGKDKTSSSLERLNLTVDGKNSTGGSEVNVKLSLAMSGVTYGVSGSGMYDKDANLYLKVNDVRKLVDQLSADGMAMPSAFNDLIGKVDGAWIKISASDLKDFSEDTASSQTCVNDVIKKYESDQAITNELVDLYSRNRFIVVKEKLGSKDGSLGYRIEGDEAKAKSFAKGAKDTKLFKELKNCDKSFDFNVDDLFSDTSNDISSSSRIELWVNHWSHQLEKVSIAGGDEQSEGSIVVEPRFNQPVTISIPKDVITLSQLKADIEKAYTAYSEQMTLEINASQANMQAEIDAINSGI